MELILIPITAILNRIRGGGIIPFPEWLPRKLVSGVILSILVAVIVNFSCADCQLYQSFLAGSVALGGWYCRNLVGTHRGLDILWHKNVEANILFMCARGLLTLATTIPLAYVLGNWWIAPLGLIGALQGIWYKVATWVPISKQNTFVELADGATYGLILFLCVTLST